MTDKIRPAHNPYFDYTAVRDPAMFFGRDEELGEIYEASSRLQSISLVGLRHIGKSSIFGYMNAQQIHKKLAEESGYDLSKHIFVLIDLREYLHKNREDFLKSVSTNIFAHAQEMVTLTLSAKSGEDQLSELLEQLEKVHIHPVLLMDAFDKVTNNPQFDPNFFSFLRSLATRGRVSYITASIKQLYEMAHEQILDSPFFDIFTTCKIGPLVHEAAERLVRLPAERAGGEFTPQEVAWVLEQAGRHPFFLQVTCRFLFDAKYKYESEALDMQQVQERAYHELLPHFEKVWRDLSPEQQKALKQESIAGGRGKRQMPELSESLLFRRYLYEQFNVDQLEITVRDVREALDHLDNSEALAESKISGMYYVAKRYQKDASPSLHKKATIVRDFLRKAFEHTRAGDNRNDSAFEWRIYNILYYRYFRYHLPNEQTAARLGIGSKRQYYREQERALQALLKELIELEVSSLNES